MKSTTDSIRKQIEINAPAARVWQALTDHRQFSEWFGCKLEAPFAVGTTVRGRITIPGYEHVVMEVKVHAIDPQRYFAYYWHPYAVDPKVDYTKETPTLVEFHLEPLPNASGTLLRVVESGFDAVPTHRRDEAFRMNSGGWEAQIKNIQTHAQRPHQS